MPTRCKSDRNISYYKFDRDEFIHVNHKNNTYNEQYLNICTQNTKYSYKLEAKNEYLTKIEDKSCKNEDIIFERKPRDRIYKLLKPPSYYEIYEKTSMGKNRYMNIDLKQIHNKSSNTISNKDKFNTSKNSYYINDGF